MHSLKQIDTSKNSPLRLESPASGNGPPQMQSLDASGIGCSTELVDPC